MTRKEIAKVLKDLRVSSGYSQKEAAEYVGKKQQTLASWETAQSQPDANTLFVLCELYGASVDQAFGFHTTGNKKPVTSEELRIIFKFRKLDERGKQAVCDTLDRECEYIEMQQAKVETESLDWNGGILKDAKKAPLPLDKGATQKMIDDNNIVQRLFDLPIEKLEFLRDNLNALILQEHEAKNG